MLRISSSTCSLQCEVYEKKKVQGRVDQKRCYGRITIKIGGRLKTQPKNCNSKKLKYEWNEKFSCTDNIPKLRKGDVEGSSGTESSSDSESE